MFPLPLCYFASLPLPSSSTWSCYHADLPLLHPSSLRSGPAGIATTVAAVVVAAAVGPLTLFHGPPCSWLPCPTTAVAAAAVIAFLHLAIRPATALSPSSTIDALRVLTRHQPSRGNLKFNHPSSLPSLTHDRSSTSSQQHSRVRWDHHGRVEMVVQVSNVRWEILTLV
ncbi:hypothetical protein K438DRAFT_1956107 [Mycena galopus ATCC 62051]|nr:hypothetical protein K438DRAFT_1956107 [Mycena galopus ATCC 62051]